MNKLALLLWPLLLSLGQGSPAPKIVATFLPIYAHVKSVAGDLATVDCLVGKGASPHDFAFKPSDVKKIAEADLLFMNGAGIEEWLKPMLRKVGSKSLQVVDLSEGVDFLESGECLNIQGATHADAHAGHRHGDINPHTWLDPVIAQAQVQKILETLQKADPERAKRYQMNAENYLTKLQRLDQAFRSEVMVLPNKNLLTLHSSFAYLAARYQFNNLGAVEDFPEKSPTPKHVAGLVSLIKLNRVGTLFAESGYSARALQSIARETGAKIAILDTIELGEPQAEAYLQRMLENLKSLKQAWTPIVK